GLRARVGLDNPGDVAVGVRELREAPGAGDVGDGRDHLPAGRLDTGDRGGDVVHLDVEGHLVRTARRSDAPVDPGAFGVDHAVADLGVDMDLPVEEQTVEVEQRDRVLGVDLEVDDRAPHGYPLHPTARCKRSVDHDTPSGGPRMRPVRAETTTRAASFRLAARVPSPRRQPAAASSSARLTSTLASSVRYSALPFVSDG